MLSKIPGVDGKGVLSAIGIDVDEVEKRGNESIAKGKKIAEEFAKIKNKVTAPNAQYIYEQEVREGGGVAGSGGTDQKSRNAVSKLASEAAKHKRRRPSPFHRVIASLSSIRRRSWHYRRRSRR